MGEIPMIVRGGGINGFWEFPQLVGFGPEAEIKGMMKGNFMNKGIAILSAVLLTTSIYGQAYEKPPTDPAGLSKQTSSESGDYRSRQSEAGAPSSSEYERASGYEKSASTSNNSTGQSSGENISASPGEGYSNDRFNADTSPNIDSSSSTDTNTTPSISVGPSVSITTNPEQSLSDQGSAAESEWDLSGGDAPLRGDLDLNSRFDRSNRGYSDLSEPDMIYEEWTVVEPDVNVGAPGQTQSGSNTSEDSSLTYDRQDRNFDWQVQSDLNNGEAQFHDDTMLDENGQVIDPSGFLGTDMPQNSGAAAGSESGAKDSELYPECFTPEDAGTSPDFETGSSVDGDRTFDGVVDADKQRYHLNRGQDNRYHINRRDDRSRSDLYRSNEIKNRDSVGSSSSAPGESGSASSRSDSDYAQDLMRRVQDRWDHPETMRAPEF